ncbi:hypothetical protein [Lacticaseibacillus parakribbianus]|uniref:hypothetical protein n=1 Tax=Lacticaseibacillus parakribbianus TaxID=2970927 RepID=UPI0021CB5D03|nr:hypothetical protein [Lacticaseibacillus parakribbianus]
MKKVIAALLTALTVLLVLTACGGAKAADYPTAAKAEAALNAGKKLEGKTVTFKVLKVEPRSAFGYNLEAGKHLNFASAKNPGVKKGATVTVKVKKVASMLGSYIISYTDLKQ